MTPPTVYDGIVRLIAAAWQSDLGLLGGGITEADADAFRAQMGRVNDIEGWTVERSAPLGNVLRIEGLHLDADRLARAIDEGMRLAEQELRAPEPLLGTADAAAGLGVSQARVRALIDAGRLPAEKLGRDWLIRASDLDGVRERKPGRPRPPKADSPPAP